MVGGCPEGLERAGSIQEVFFLRYNGPGAPFSRLPPRGPTQGPVGMKLFPVMGARPGRSANSSVHSSTHVVKGLTSSQGPQGGGHHPLCAGGRLGSVLVLPLLRLSHLKLQQVPVFWEEGHLPSAQACSSQLCGLTWMAVVS
jgi:hypothetical protein